MYLYATYIAVHRDTVSKEAVYIAVGIREVVSKQVLAYTIAQWNQLTIRAAERNKEQWFGVEDVLLFVSVCFKGMADNGFNMFPKAKYQVCLVHVGPNIAHKVCVEDCQEICEDFKTIHQASNAEVAEKIEKSFTQKY